MDWVCFKIFCVKLIVYSYVIMPVEACGIWTQVACGWFMLLKSKICKSHLESKVLKGHDDNPISFIEWPCRCLHVKGYISLIHSMNFYWVPAVP